MPQVKGHAKVGGRVKGTPNKSTVIGKSVLTELLSTYYESGLMSSDFMALEPKDRLQISERWMQYLIPKPRTDIGITNSSTNSSIEDKLVALADDIK